MQITEIVISLREEDRLKAFVNVTFDNCFVVRGMKIIEGSDGLFISMPSRKAEDGTYRDVAHPINNEFRQKIEKAILEKYNEALAVQSPQKS
jgi:stage V sporulation protein G